MDNTNTVTNTVPQNLVAGLDPTQLRNVTLNAMLQAVDQIVREGTNDPATQMGVLMIAQAMTFRRLRHVHKIEGPRRRMILKKAVADFEEKIRKFGYEDEPANIADHKL